MNLNINRSLAIIVALGIVQGLMLLLGHQLLNRDIVDAAHRAWLLPWYAAAVGVPAALQLMVTEQHDRRMWWFGLALAGVLALTGGYTALAVYPGTETDASAVIMPYVLTTVLGWYVLLPFVQAWLKTGRLAPPYAELFDFAWNNGITLLIAGAFTGIFWGLLGLWAALFKVIGIDVFTRAFFNPHFGWLASATVFAFAVYVGRSHVSAVVTVRRIILAIFKGLLPLLALIVVLFLAALPFMGLKPLWATGKATSLMLSLQILLVIFLNAVFQDGRNVQPYPAWLRGAIRVAIVLLPVYTLLCAYALYLRVDQHGWTTDRFWAVLLTLTIGLHVFGYAWAAARRSAVWMQGMAPVNVMVAAIVVLLAVAVNSPAVDARRLSAHSQVDRLLSGATNTAHFDYNYLRFELGAAGHAALLRLRDIKDHADADKIRLAAAAALTKTNRWQTRDDIVESADELAEHLTLYPRNARFDADFLAYLLKNKRSIEPLGCFAAGSHCAVLAIDLNADRRNEYVLFSNNNRWAQEKRVYARQAQAWQLVGRLGEPGSGADAREIEAALERGDYAAVASPWQDLRVGSSKQQFDEN